MAAATSVPDRSDRRSVQEHGHGDDQWLAAERWRQLGHRDDAWSRSTALVGDEGSEGVPGALAGCGLGLALEEHAAGGVGEPDGDLQPRRGGRTADVLARPDDLARADRLQQERRRDRGEVVAAERTVREDVTADGLGWLPIEQE